MSNSVFLFDNDSDTALVSASSSVLPATNVQNPQRSKFWRSATGTSSSLSVTLNDVFGVSYIALVDMNLTTGGTITVQAWSDAIDGMSPVYDETFTPTLYVSSSGQAVAYGSGSYGLGAYGSNQAIGQLNNRNITLIPIEPTLIVRFYKITFTDLNTTFQQLGRLFIGSGLVFQNNLAYGWQAERIERSVAKESIGGQRYTQPRDSRLKLSGNFNFLSEQERTEILIRLQEFGESKPFIFSIFPESTNLGLTTTVYGRFDGKTIQQIFQNINQFSFSVVEEL